MKTLTIKDLPVTEELDRRAMSAVRGGYSAFYYPGFDTSKLALSFNTEQLNNQTQNTINENGGNVAFAHDITSNVHPVQTATNSSNINIGSTPRVIAL